LSFPESWDGYYIIDENAEDYIKISFVGESETSKYIESEDPRKVAGLTMFYIGNEKYLKNCGQ